MCQAREGWTLKGDMGGTGEEGDRERWTDRLRQVEIDKEMVLLTERQTFRHIDRQALTVRRKGQITT